MRADGNGHTNHRYDEALHFHERVTRRSRIAHDAVFVTIMLYDHV